MHSSEICQFQALARINVTMAHISCDFFRVSREMWKLLPEWRYERFTAHLSQCLACKGSVNLKLANWYGTVNNQRSLLPTCVSRLSLYLVIRTFICIPSKFQIHLTTQQASIISIRHFCSSRFYCEHEKAVTCVMDFLTKYWAWLLCGSEKSGASISEGFE